MKIIRIAFYKAWNNPKARLLDKTIAVGTFGSYSHVELVLGHYAYSVSNRDGGVRRKPINVDSLSWKVIELKVSNTIYRKLENTLKRSIETDNRTYDLLGAILSAVSLCNGVTKKKTYCSKYVSAMLMHHYVLPPSFKICISPSFLYEELQANGLLYK